MELVLMLLVRSVFRFFDVVVMEMSLFCCWCIFVVVVKFIGMSLDVNIFSNVRDVKMSGLYIFIENFGCFLFWDVFDLFEYLFRGVGNIFYGIEVVIND